MTNIDLPISPLVLLILIIVLILILLYLLWASRRGRFPFPRPTYPPEEFFVQDQLILSGPLTVIENAVNHVENVSLERLDRLDFGVFGDRLLGCPGIPDSTPENPLVIDQYKILGWAPSVSRAIAQINRALGDQSDQVVKDPNWLTGQPFEVEGSPFEVEGSPFEVEGSPFEVEGSGIYKPVREVDSDLFPRQWGFQTIELDPAAGLFPGGGVRVGVFDSSPFRDIPLDTVVIRGPGPDGKPSTLLLEVLHPTVKTALQRRIRHNKDLRNHGYFVAGLIKAIAPESEVRLIRVLENDNRGDLFTLLRAIYDFMREAVLDNPPEVGEVVNISAGVRMAPPEARLGLPDQVRALEIVVNATRCLGGVVVAAAGNESFRSNLPLQPSYPAFWNTALGVAASNRDNRRACFSNRGDIAAPGGDGKGAPPPAPQPDVAAGDNRGEMVAGQPAGARVHDIPGPGPDGQPDGGCGPRVQDCGEGDCDFGVIGPVIKPPYRDEEDTCYIFWTGSSFSTPMVAGLAARVLEAGQAIGGFTPDQVDFILACGASPTEDRFLGKGIINVRCTLTQCLQVRVEKPCQESQEQRETYKAAEAV